MSQDQAPTVAELAEFEKTLTGCGFTEVKISQVPLPKRIGDWMRTERDFSGRSDEQLGEVMSYFQVESGQGEFGVFWLEFPAIDLNRTGVTYKDIYPDSESPPDDVPSLVGYGFLDEADVIRFRELLAAHRSAPAA